MRVWNKITLTCLVLSMVSCGDPLATGEYLGEPLFSFEGIIVSILDDLPEENSVRVALGWAPGGTEPTHVNELVEQDSVSVQVRFPSAFEVNIFYPPLDDFLQASSQAYGLAYLVVYEDSDGDEHFDAQEVLGGAPNQVIVYAARDLLPEQSPTRRSLPQGFHLIPVPAPCMAFDNELDAPVCTVPIGAECISDSDCNGGTCLDELAGTNFPGGYCSLREDRQNCVPPDAIAWPLYDELGDPGEMIESGQGHELDHWWWFKRCITSQDCREDEGYICNLGWGACTPKVPAWLVIGDELRLPQVCWENEGPGFSDNY